MPEMATFVVDQIAEDQESWRATPELQACWKLEDLLGVGLRLYRQFSDADEKWSQDVQAGKSPFKAKKAAQIRAAYDWWLRPCDSVLARVVAMEQQFGVVRGAEDFRNARLTVKALTRVPLVAILKGMAETPR